MKAYDHQCRRDILGKRIDRAIRRPVIGIPLFFAVMSIVFLLTFSTVGMALSVSMEKALLSASEKINELLHSAQAPAWFCRFLTEGVLTGIGSVLSYLPQTAILFFLLSLLEQCGYFARAAYALDPITRPFGLSGRAVLPMTVAFGCTVPAVMATESLDGEERRTVLAALPFLPCSARLPIILMTASLFEGKEALVSFFLYTISLTTALFSSLLSSRGKTPPPLSASLVPCQSPSLRALVIETGEKLKDFLIRAATVVLLSQILFDLPATLTPTLTLAERGDESILALLCALVAPLFAPLGFGDGKTTAALIAGIFAKESVVSTLTFLSYPHAPVFSDPADALSFAVFSLLYLPCAMTLDTLRLRLGWKKTLLFCLRTFVLAYLSAYMTYTLAKVLLLCTK